MNELDIMRNMSHCIKGECSVCEYSTKEGCRDKLMRDANCILKMQHDAMKDFPAEIEKLKAEVVRLTPFARFNFNEVDLVKMVNKVAHDCFEVDCDDSESFDWCYMRMIMSLLDFGAMLPGEYKVLITGIKNAPELVKR